MDERRETVLVRSAEAEDASALTALHVRITREAYVGLFPDDKEPPKAEGVRRDWEGTLTEEGIDVLVAIRGGEILGSGLLRPLSEESGELKRIHVDPDHWREGIGRLLVDHLVKQASKRGFRELKVSVIDRNDRARRFFERGGWRLIPCSGRFFPDQGNTEVEYQLQMDQLSEVRALITARRASFRDAGEEYDRVRPQYPEAAITWAIGRTRGFVVDVGCGTGKLTSQLAALGHSVVGVDPSMAMLKGMNPKGLAAISALAEALPLRTASADAISAAQAFHWFAYEQAVPEMGRVLRPNGRVGLLWNLRDEDVDWVASLSRIIGSEDAMSSTLGPTDDFEADVTMKLQYGGTFEAVESESFKYEQELTEEGLVDLVRSRSYVAILPDEERNEVISNVHQLCREHPQLRGQRAFRLPYITRAFRARPRTRP